MFFRFIFSVSSLLLLLSGCATQDATPRTCALHQIPMSRELVVLRNGSSSWEYQEAREKYFPYSGTVYTGNVLPNTQQQIAQADICPECRKTEMKWFQGDLKEKKASNANESHTAEPNPNADPSLP